MALFNRFLTPENTGDAPNQKMSPEERLKAAMAKSQIHAPKAANDNLELSMSDKVEVASTESRLEELRKALAKHAETAEAGQLEVAEVNTSEPEAVEIMVKEQAPAPVLETKQPETKAPLPQYSNLSGIDVDKLPKNIPEAKGVSKLVEIEKLQTTMKLEVRDLKDFTVNADRINSFISSQELSGISEEFYKRIVAATTAKREEAVKKAGEIVADANAEISRLQDKIGEIDPMVIKAFDVLSKKPSVEMPIGYKAGGGKEFWSAANDNSPANALIKAFKKAA